MSLLQTQTIDNDAVLSEALLNAAKALGMTQAQVGAVIGKDRSSLNRGLSPSSKAGELALLFIRCYRGLYVLIGGKPDDMKHWMHTKNRHTGGIPAQQVQTVQGRNHVLEYLDVMRGKI